MNYELLKEPIISIIVAIGQNREIGKNNRLLWHLKEDLNHFKKITLGHPIIMGRKTYESIGKPLPGRFNIIITRLVLSIPSQARNKENVAVCNSLEKAIKIAKAKDQKEIFIIGGASVYKQAIGLADKLYLTLVEASFEADAFFPDYSGFKKVISDKTYESDDYKYRFMELIR